jgi:hypothetical protein
MFKEEVREKVTGAVTWANNLHDRLEALEYEMADDEEGQQLLKRLDAARNDLVQAVHLLDKIEAKRG